MPIFTLYVSESEFMSHSHQKHLVFSRNKVELKKLATMLEATSNNLTASVYPITSPLHKIAIVSYTQSDWNYSSSREEIVFLEEIPKKLSAYTKEQPEGNVSDRTIIPVNGLTQADRCELLKDFTPHPKQFIKGFNRKKRALKSGAYYLDPFDFDEYQGVSIGLLPQQNQNQLHR